MKAEFICGHVGIVNERAPSPRCPLCGVTGIARCFAPAPRIRGTASGPHVDTVHLEPIAVDLTTPRPAIAKPEGVPDVRQ